MRQLLLAFFLSQFAAPASATAADVIKPGMHLKDVRSILRRHDYKFGDQYTLAMVADDKDSELFFCEVDSDIVLIAVYKKSTGIVASMSVNFYPEKPTPKTERLIASRRVRKVMFEEDGDFTVSLERVFRKPND
ncbi:MAG TPA: hypothetical protein VF175_18625 [Lacipirellula sp.]